MATIKDVAKCANVSVATVSRYLNQKGYISEKSAQQIEWAIQHLQYKPSKVARSLSTKRSHVIGLIVPDIQNPYFPELARAIEDTAWKYGYTVILCNTDEQQQKERLYIENLSQQYVAGMIVTTALEDATPYAQLDMPIVALDRQIGEHIPTVQTNNFQGAQTAVTYLLEGGSKHVACISGPMHLTPSQQRVAGFLHIIEETHIPYTIVQTTFEFQQAIVAVRELLEANPSIDSIFACSDTIAMAALHVAHDMQYDVPAQLQIVGFDGIKLGEMLYPPLTTVGQKLYELGESATEMLIAQIEGKPIDEPFQQVDAQLIVRGTTRKDRTQ